MKEEESTRENKFFFLDTLIGVCSHTRTPCLSINTIFSFVGDRFTVTPKVGIYRASQWEKGSTFTGHGPRAATES